LQFPMARPEARKTRALPRERAKRERSGSDSQPMPASSAPAAVAALGDSELIQRAQAGQAAAFEQIYNDHKRRVYALCLRMAGNAPDAEEFCQEAFMQLFRKIHTFRGDSSFSTWLHRLTVNVVLMRFRKKRVPEVSLESQTDPDEDSGVPPREIGEPDLRLSGALDRMNLERAIAQLPAGYKEMFILHDIEGYDHGEIARIAGCSVGNSKSQLHKARTRLRKLLRETLREKARRTRKGAKGTASVISAPAASKRDCVGAAAGSQA
jgi:RNA polymerase sigma-70 factor, ECF subfamily